MMTRLALLVGVLGGLAAAGAAAQGLSPTPIAPPTTGSSQQEWERAERAREQLNYQRERDRLDLERRALQNEAIREDGDRGLLGAPVVVEPGAPPYGAPQYPYAGPGYPAQGGYGPGYGPGYAPGAYGPTVAPRGSPPGYVCRQTAPAYDEAGRFLATVCVR